MQCTGHASALSRHSDQQSPKCALNRSDSSYFRECATLSHPMHTTPCSAPTAVVCRPKIILNAEQAVAIYKLNPTPCTDRSNTPKVRGQSIPIAARYGVSPKTVREIWSLKTWAKATEHLRNQTQTAMHACYDSRICNTVSPLF